VKLTHGNTHIIQVQSTKYHPNLLESSEQYVNFNRNYVGLKMNECE